MEKKKSFRGGSHSRPQGRREERNSGGHRTHDDRREGSARQFGDDSRKSDSADGHKGGQGRRFRSGDQEFRPRRSEDDSRQSEERKERPTRHAKPNIANKNEHQGFDRRDDERGGKRTRPHQDGERRSYGRDRRSWDGRGRGEEGEEEREYGHRGEKQRGGRLDFDKKRKKDAHRPATLAETDPNKIRLNRYVANSGVCSRRDADALIEAGEITVNGKVVTSLGTVISRDDKVKYNGKILNPQNKVYILLNKPKNAVTTIEDPEDRMTVMDLIKDACPERVYPVGRLDRQTTGLLLFTNDGDLAKALTHPKSECRKIYHVYADKPIQPEHLEAIAAGVELEDGLMRADKISFVDQMDQKQAGIEIHSGKNRVVRRLFEHFGYNVEKLDRVYFAGLTKQGVARGKWRFLTEKEVSMLKAGFFK